MKKQEVAKIIKRLFKDAKQLSDITRRPCTLDGHLIGSIGEAYAATKYKIDLEDPGNPAWDARTYHGRRVQIKTTQRSRILLKHTEVVDLLLVLKINDDGRLEEVYNGLGKSAWEKIKHRVRMPTGQISISLGQLKEIPKSRPSDQVPKR